MAAANKSFFVVELYDPDDDKGLAYFQDHGAWVRSPADAKHFSEEYKAQADHSVLSQHFLYVRVMEYNPSVRDG